VAQGSDINNRIGRHIRALHVDLVFSVGFIGGANLNGDSLGLFVFLDKSASVGLPSASDVLDLSVAQCGCALINAPKFGQRFQLLYTKDLAVGPGGPDQVTIRVRIPIPARYSVLEYAASTTAYPVTNAIGMLFGDLNSNVDIDYQFAVQLFYEDM
jgi:hypothetical protein